MKIWGVLIKKPLQRAENINYELIDPMKMKYRRRQIKLEVVLVEQNRDLSCALDTSGCRLIAIKKKILTDTLGCF